jgi:hypothetical protein
MKLLQVQNTVEDMRECQENFKKKERMQKT